MHLTIRQASLMSARLALMTIMRPNPRDPAGPADAAAAETRIREIAALNAGQDIALLRVIEASKAVLTPDQRGRLAALMRGTASAPVSQQSL
jgi:hypothetical protein